MLIKSPYGYNLETCPLSTLVYLSGKKQNKKTLGFGTSPVKVCPPTVVIYIK